MILQPSNNALSSGSASIGPQALSVPNSNNVSSKDMASVSFSPSVNVEISSSKLVASAIPPIYSKPTVYSSNTSQLSPSRSSSSSGALAENAILSKPDASGTESTDKINTQKDVQGEQENKKTDTVASSFELSEEELKIIEELKARDSEVRAHEQAHKSVGGQYTGAISLTYQAGPDGKRYAVGGEVPIDVSPIPGDPQATITKMSVVSAAATAPAQPSAQDQAVAAQAARLMAEAQAELAQSKYTNDVDEKDDEQAGITDSNSSQGSNSRYKNNSLEQFQTISSSNKETVNLVDALV